MNFHNKKPIINVERGEGSIGCGEGMRRGQKLYTETRRWD